LAAGLVEGNNQISTRYPTYGDPSRQPTAFRIVFDVAGPLPPTQPTGDRFQWERGPTETSQNAFSWVTNDVPAGKKVIIRRLQSNGSLRADYNGTATLSWVKTGGSGQLSMNIPANRTFINGVTTEFVIDGDYVYNNAQGSQSFGYADITATDGSITGTAGVSILNHR